MPNKSKYWHLINKSYAIVHFKVPMAKLKFNGQNKFQETVSKIRLMTIQKEN